MPLLNLKNLPQIVANIRPLDILELVILLGFLYGCYRSLRNTRAFSLIKGLFILLAGILLANCFGLHYITYILEQSFLFFVVAAAVVFTPEIRRILEWLGSLEFFGGSHIINPEQITPMLRAVGDAIANMSRRHVGCLICFERNTGLQEYIDSGIPLDALVSSGLLINIFEKNTPLHDGAVIIRSNKVAAATCYLPMTEQFLPKSLGTRHRAAVGLSEQSDALVLVVSEETGDISAARDGKLIRFLTANDVQALMVEHLYSKMKVDVVAKMISGSYDK